MSRIPVRFIISILTFVLGVTLTWGLNARRQAAVNTKTNIAHSETPEAKTTTPTIPDYITEDERKEWYGYGAEGIKCRVSFASDAWVPRQPVILKVEFENTTDKDFVIPSKFELELMNKLQFDREIEVSGQRFGSDGWFETVKSEPISMYSSYRSVSQRQYDRLMRQSFVLHAGETKRLESPISYFQWNCLISSMWSDYHFADIVPPGEYEFLMRIRGRNWMIVSSRIDIRVE